MAHDPGANMATERRTCSQSSAVWGVDDEACEWSISATVANVCSLCEKKVVRSAFCQVALFGGGGSDLEDAAIEAEHVHLTVLVGAE